MRFSERYGYTPPKLMQVDSIDEDTRNQLWDLTWDVFQDFVRRSINWRLAEIYHRQFQKRSMDDFVFTAEDFRSNLKQFFFSSSFFELLNFMEFVGERVEGITKVYNEVLLREKVGYRFVDRLIVPISDEVEQRVLEEALSNVDRFAGARSHITAALAAFSKRPTADYRNAIREAISAVESAAKVIAGNDNADLGAALKAIDKAHGMHPAFREAVIKLYAYTSDEKGIRHALLDEDAKVDEADAHFMLVACAAFVNFLVQRYGG